MQVIPRNIPKDCDSDLTEGATYDVSDIEWDEKGQPDNGWIIDDEGHRCFILIGDLPCAYLADCISNRQGYWEIVPE